MILELLSYLSFNTVFTEPSVRIRLTRLKSPTNIEPSGEAAKATGAKSRSLDAVPSQDSGHSNGL